MDAIGAGLAMCLLSFQCAFRGETLERKSKRDCSLPVLIGPKRKGEFLVTIHKVVRAGTSYEVFLEVEYTGSESTIPIRRSVNQVEVHILLSNGESVTRTGAIIVGREFVLRKNGKITDSVTIEQIVGSVRGVSVEILGTKSLVFIPDE